MACHAYPMTVAADLLPIRCAHVLFPPLGADL